MQESAKELSCLKLPDLTKLNDAQRKAVTHGEGPLLLLAGPGSGKTFTITNRILYLLGNGVPPESILVITFTREAAISMQRRFREMSGKMIYPVNFGTFHSFFYQILQKSNPIHTKKLLKDSEKKALLIPILKQYSNQQSGQSGQDTADSLREDAVQILSAVSFYKNTMNSEEAVKKMPQKWQPCFEQVLEAYESSVRKSGAMDFDDMLYLCRRLFTENENLRREWQNRFSHILIDEFQDINPVQYEVIRLLAKKPCNIFAVGDDDQAIYGFRGAEPDCLRRFAEEFGAEKLLLDMNYRSREEIVQASLAVIGENKNRFFKELHAAESGQKLPSQTSADGWAENTVVCTAFMDREEQYGYMTSVLRQAVQEKDSCAVLFRTNAFMQGFAARLKRAGIPYEIREKAASIYEHFIVKDVMAYLSLAHGSTKKEDLLRIVNKPSRYVSREAVAECGVDFTGLRAYYKKADIEVSYRLSVENALNMLERQLQSIGKLPLHLGVNYILRATGYGQYLRECAVGKSALTGSYAVEDRWQAWQELLEWLKGDAAQYESLETWREAQENYTETLSEGAVRNRMPKERADLRPVQLMTAHAAKGLEFDRVWIPDCNEKIFPYGRLQDEKTLEEERRLFYVAMTRAKKSLELLYLTGTRERPRLPSRFLNKIYSSSISSSNSQLSRYSSNASETFSYTSSSSIYSRTGSSLGSSGFSL